MNDYDRSHSVSQMIEELGWDSLASRRRANRLSVFAKAYNECDSLRDISLLITKAHMPSLRAPNLYRVNQIHCRKNIGHYSFTPRSIQEWNALPKNILNNETSVDPILLRSKLLTNT